MMKNFLFAVLFSAVIFSCAIPAKPLVYSQPQFVKLSHEEVMTEDFPTKKSVFVKFGTPTNKETYENIENWYFKLGEVTSSSSIGLSTGNGRISQDPSNPYLRPVDRSLVTNQTQINSIRTNSSTVETYVKFWFENDSVTKWETFGVDYSRMVLNPNYNESEAEKYEELKQKWQEQKYQRQKRNAPVTFVVVFAAMVAFLVFFGGSM